MIFQQPVGLETRSLNYMVLVRKTETVTRKHDVKTGKVGIKIKAMCNTRNSMVRIDFSNAK